MQYNLNAELWAEFAIGMIVFVVRFYARWKTIGIRNFSWDDFFAALSVVFWTLETTFLYTCALHGNNITLNEETAELVRDSEVPLLEKGSQLAFAAWVFYILLVWSLKGVVIFLYSRITTGLWQHRLVKFVSIFCITTFLASFLLHFCQCVPIQRNWQVKPFPGDSCTKRTLNYIVIEVLNILTDASIITIPLPLILSAKLPLYRKIILGVLFSSGIFIIICAILRAYYSVKNIKDLSVALGWASREVFVSALAVCSPGIKPLFNKNRWFSSKQSSAERYYGSVSLRAKGSSYGWSMSRGRSKEAGVSVLEERDGNERDVELASVAWPGEESRESLDGSEVGIVRDRSIRIQVTTEYHVEGDLVGNVSK